MRLGSGLKAVRLTGKFGYRNNMAVGRVLLESLTSLLLQAAGRDRDRPGSEHSCLAVRHAAALHAHGQCHHPGPAAAATAGLQHPAHELPVHPTGWTPDWHSRSKGWRGWPLSIPAFAVQPLG